MARLLAAAGATAAAELAPRVYPRLSGLAAELGVRATRAALRYLVEEGRAEIAGEDRFRAVS